MYGKIYGFKYKILCGSSQNVHICLLFTIFLTYFILYNRHQVHPPHYNWLKLVPFYGQVIFHCVCAPLLLYPLICRWTSKLFPCPCYCKQCCDKHQVTRVFQSCGDLRVHAQYWDCWVMRQFCSQFLKKSPQLLFSTVVVSIYSPTNSARELLFLHIFSSIYCLQILLMMVILTSVR